MKKLIEIVYNLLIEAIELVPKWGHGVSRLLMTYFATKDPLEFDYVIQRSFKLNSWRPRHPPFSGIECHKSTADPEPNLLGIDGQKKAHDEHSWLQKFTPLHAKSAWFVTRNEARNRCQALVVVTTGRYCPGLHGAGQWA